MQRILAWFRKHRSRLLLLLVAALVYQYAVSRAHEEKLFAWPASRWMNIYNYADFQSWEQIGEYFLELRTGIPPVVSLLEILAYQSEESWKPVTNGLYRHFLALLFAVPFLFLRGRWWEILLALAGAWVLLESVIIVHRGNPQIYDVMLPVFLLVYLLCNRASVPNQKGQMIFAALAGFFLSMAELSRPFMIAAVSLLLVYQFFLYYQKSRANWLRKLLIFLLPLLLFSGLWHAKLLVRNGQLIWSNHGGSNLVNAWQPLVDFETLNSLLQPEAPPREINDWTAENLNTELHAQNSKLRAQAVMAGIKAQPREAWRHFLFKANVFLRPQVDMYAYQPKDEILIAYKWLVNAFYGILAFLLARLVSLAFTRPSYLLETEAVVILLTTFLTLMPIIGENGEEARFMVSVLPLLFLCGYYGLRWFLDQFQPPALDLES